MSENTNTPGLIPGVHTYAGDCPVCGQAIMAEQRRLPHLCPTCSHPLRSLNPGSPWQNVLHCLRLYVDPRGRATRREFWAFTLSSLTLLAVESIAILLCYRNGVLASVPVWVWWIVPALLVCPFAAVTIRRLHDLGRSAGMLVICLVLALLGSVGVALHGLDVMPEIFTDSLADWAWAMLRADIILFFVLLYTATQHRTYGPNQYGPAPK